MALQKASPSVDGHPPADVQDDAALPDALEDADGLVVTRPV